MILLSAVAKKKQRRFEHISRQVRIYLDIIPDDILYFSILAPQV